MQRCVNGLVEPGQRGSSAVSVQSLARNIGLPAWVVDMRHEISHKELPSLSTLRLGSDFLLQYLWRCVSMNLLHFFLTRGMGFYCRFCFEMKCVQCAPTNLTDNS